MHSGRHSQSVRNLLQTLILPWSLLPPLIFLFSESLSLIYQCSQLMIYSEIFLILRRDIRLLGVDNDPVSRVSSYATRPLSSSLPSSTGCRSDCGDMPEIPQHSGNAQIMHVRACKTTTEIYVSLAWTPTE